MGSAGRWIALLGCSGFGAGALGSMNPEALQHLSSLDFHSLQNLQNVDLGALNPIFNDMKETIKYVQEQAVPEIRKLMEHKNLH